MAMPKKRGLRSIVVDEVPYLWRASRRGGNLFVSVLQDTDGESSLLSVDTSAPHANGCCCPQCSSVFMMPAVVEAYIRQALARGWKPDEKGKSFMMIADAAMATGKT